MKKFKDIVKQNPEPAKGKSGTDPMDPWNAKSGIAEASENELLHRYLKSRGINPDYIPKDTKIAHSKSAAYLSWRKAHEFDESVEILEATDEKDMVCFDIPLLIRVLEFTREDMKTDIELHNMVERLINMRETYPLTMKHYDAITQKLVKEESQELDEEELEEGRMKDIATNAAETSRLNKMSTLQKFRADSGAREKKHDAIEKNSGGMTSAIDRLEKHMNKEEAEQIEEASKKEWSKSARIIRSIYKKKGMKEETYDWEKDDKNTQVYGKKPKLKDTPSEDNVGENKPDARAILSGGKTMTGEKRDDVEIDPFMKKPKNNTPDDFDKPTNKKDH